MVEAAEPRDAFNTSRALRHSRNRLLLSERLVRTRLVVEVHVLGHETPQVLIADDQNVIEELPEERPVVARYSFRAVFAGSEASMPAGQRTRSAAPIRR